MPISRTRGRATYLALAAVDSYLAGRPGPKARKARLFTKPLLMPTLAAATHLAKGTRNDTLLRGTQVAQLCSWRGDVALLGTSRKSFLGGVAAFALAHVSYIAAFSSARAPESRLNDPGPKVATAVWAATAPVMSMAAGRKDPSMRLPIAAYSAILSAMFATSTTLTPSVPRAARRKILLGTALFLTSDSLLGVQEFLRTDRSPTLESAVMATYTAGQWFIAEGVVAAR